MIRDNNTQGVTLLYQTLKFLQITADDRKSIYFSPGIFGYTFLGIGSCKYT